MYFNRDLSWLQFNYRVLLEAADKEVPLMERYKFLSIFASNLDEFFAIRYPVIRAISKLKAKTQRKISSDIPENPEEKIQTEIRRQLDELNQIMGQLLAELENEGIILYYNKTFKPEHLNEMREIFLSKVLAFVQPVFLETETAFQFKPESNKLYMVITLKKNASEVLEHTVIKIPSDNLKRFYQLSPIDGIDYIAIIDDIIRMHISYVFPGFEVMGVYSIKFTRNSELDLQEDYNSNILKKIKRQLKKREYAPLSMFLYQADMPSNVLLFLVSSFDIDLENTFAVSKYHNLRDFMSFSGFYKKLMYDAVAPLSPASLPDVKDLFSIIEQRNVLLHLPYHSYNPILSFFNQAAVDPEVREIYITLYRVAAASLIVNALISAAMNGKKVTVFIELKARFDEANNINWGERMTEAGIKIIYSIPGIKVHSKIALVVKNDHKQKKMYAIIGTGNFNELTARLYTDHIMLTTNPAITDDLLTLFRFLEKGRAPVNEQLKFNTIHVSHFNLLENFEKLVQKEIEKAKKSKPAFIRIKVNNLEDVGFIDLLYKASRAGVTIQLQVRGICSLIPGKPGFSDNIEVKRLVGRYLEHTRIFIFGREEPEIIIGSADLMTRNLHHRIEVCVPVLEPNCRKELVDYFDMQWKDNDKAVMLSSDMDQIRVRNDSPVFNAQQSIYNYLLTGA
jgi:polyphosphate kinase